MVDLGYSRQARRSGDSEQTADGQATPVSASRARSNTGCAAAAAVVVAVVVVVVAAAVVLLHGCQHTGKQIRSRQGISGKPRPRHKVTNGRRVPPFTVAGRHCVLDADIPRAW